MSWCRPSASPLAILALLLVTAARADEAPGPPVAAPPATPPAAAPPAPEAPRAPTLREHTDAGVRLFAEGRYDEAIAAFAAAHALRPNAVYLFNIAQCHRKAGRPHQALAAYDDFLRAAPPDSPLRPEAEGHVRTLRAPPTPPTARPLLPPPLPPAPPRAPVPVYRRPWLWVLVSLGAAGVATGLAVGISLAPRDPPTTLGSVTPTFRGLVF